MATAAKCGVCNHHHEQGVKCLVCGHTGKSRFLQQLQRAPPANRFAVQARDAFAGQPLDAGFWSFVRLLRRHIFPRAPCEFADDASCRHVIAFVGDAPIALCRWRIAQDAADASQVVVALEHFGVLEAKRGRGYGGLLLDSVVEDVAAKLAQMGLSVPALIARVPTSEAEAAMTDGGAATVSDAVLRLFRSRGFQISGMSAADASGATVVLCRTA